MPRNLGNADLKRIAFIKYFLDAVDNPDVIVIIQDEAGYRLQL